jgi:hypothetical protein
MSELPSASTRPPILQCLGLALFLTLGYVSPIALSTLWFGFNVGAVTGSLLAIGSLWGLFRYFRKRGTRGGVVAAEVLVLVVMVLWGLGLNFADTQPCVENHCDPLQVHRPLAYPAVLGLCVLHASSVLAYAIARRRSKLLPPRVELVLLSGLLLGCALQLALAIHFGRWLAYGIALAPVALPAASPVMALGLFGHRVKQRLRQHAGAQAHLAQSMGLTLVWLGLYGAITAAIAKRSTAAFDVFTKTCDYTFSQLPIVIDETPCGHYLCTVAARGHRSLVRPLRVGMRGGRPILVNRQLAIANAFEDLLTEHCPWLGRSTRRVYDRVGLPVSRWIRTPLLADLIYLAMKPAEWSFYAYLLLVDPGCPEERLNRMYCPPLDRRGPASETRKRHVSRHGATE